MADVFYRSWHGICTPPEADGLPGVTLGTVTVRPEEIWFTYRDGEAAPELDSLTVSGHRVLRQGGRGLITRLDVTYACPQWLRGLAERAAAAQWPGEFAEGPDAAACQRLLDGIAESARRAQEA